MKRRFPFLLAAVLCLVSANARAGRIEFTEYDLPNGLHVILAPDHTVPVVASFVLYHVGSKNERPDRTGFAHFFEHLMFEGSDNIPRGRIDKLVSGAGGNLNASTSFDQTEYHINLPANQVDLALWIESERMLHGKVEQIGVDTQRQVVKEERRRSYDNQPYGSLFEELAKLVFNGTPYEWVPIGSVQYIDQATLEEFRQFYKTFYVPNNATLVLSGDFDSEKEKPQIEAYFGPIPKSEEPPRPVSYVSTRRGSKTAILHEFIYPTQLQLPSPPVGSGGGQPAPTPAPSSGPAPTETAAEAFARKRPGQTIEVARQNTPLPATLHAWRACRQDEPDAYAVELLTNIIATGRSSRLYRRMVDREQAAVQASAFPYFLEDAGMVGVFAVGNRGVTLEKLDALIKEEVASVKKDGVTEEEYQKALNSKQSELASSYGTALARARGLADYHVFFGDTNKVNTELDDYLKVTREDIKRVVNKYFTDSGLNVLHYPVPTAATEASPKK